MSIFSFTIVNMSIETPDGVLDVTNATLRVPQIEVQGTSVTTSLSTLSNVGVGTTTPGGRLHVYGPDAKTLLQSTSNTANVEIGGPSGAIVDLKGPFTDDYDLRIQSSSDGGNLATTGNVNHIRLASTSGYTGFGTATPQYKIDVQGVKGIDAVSNPSAHNPVFLYDDQESTTTFSGTVGGTGASRNTTSKYIELNSLADNVTGYAYWPIQMPNSWSAEFDHFIGGGDGGESLSFSFFNTSAPTTTGNHGGYRLAIAEFYGGAPAAKAVLYYQGSEVAQKNIVGGIPSSSWNKVVVNYNRGSISLSLNGRSVFSYEATENADSYTGRYVGFIGKTGLRDNFHRVRNVKCTSGTNWVYATGSNATTLAYLSGNVGIGTDVTTERLEISGNVKATHFVGDGGLLSNIATTLNAIVNQGNTTSNTVQFTNADTGIVSTGNIVVEEGSFFVGDGSKLVNIPTDFESIIVNGNTTSNVVYFANTDVAIQASGNVVVDSDSFFIGNGGLLSNIATTLEDISNQGNTTSNTIQFTNSDVGFVTTANVGISNSAPTKNLSVGSNLHVDDTGSNVLTVHGNVAANAVTIGAFQVVASYGLNQVTAENNQTSDTLVLTNATKGIDASSNIDLGGQLNFGSNVKIVGGGSGTYLSTLRVANVASNIVTYDQATGEVFDSGGLISNKLAIVSEQPPSALTGATTVVDGHGRYKVEASSTYSTFYAYNAFDKNDSTGWTCAESSFGTDGDYDGSNSLGGVNGEYLKITFPYKTTLRHFTYKNIIDFPLRAIKQAKMLGSNDGSSWTQVASFANFTPSGNELKTVVVDATTAYKYYGFVAEKNNGDVGGYAFVNELRLFTETFTVDAGVVSTTAASGLDVGYTEHPVEPMTDYHTYVEGHGTYEASASSYDASFSLYPWEVFDHSLSTRWTISTSDDNYNASTGDWDQTAIDASPNVFTSDVGGTRYHGHWLQIKLPYAITLSHSNIYPQTTARAPVDGVILGSNDGEHWYKLTEFSGKTYSASTWTRIDVNATTSYQYFRMCATKNGGDSKVELNEWRLFAEKPVTRMENVHISGDLSSETLHTSYIKWPKVPLKANESEGYVVDASSADSGSTTKYSVFNDLFIGQGTEYWDSASTYSTSTGAHNNTVSTTDIDGVARYGEWIQIKLTNAIALHSMKWYPRIYYSSGGTYETWPLERVPKSGVIMGSNDGITWRTLRDFADISYTTAAYVEGTEVKVISSTPYVYYRLVITSLNAGTSSNRVGIMELQLFEAATGVGAAPTSAKLQVAGSLGMAKGSEFFAGDDVVMELPKHDRPLVKYPEIPITSSSTIDGYKATASSYVSREAWQAFDGTDTTSWTSDYAYSGSPLTGDQYLQLELPVAIKVVKMYIKAFGSIGYQHAPRDAELLGSNDGTTWVSLNTSTDLPLESYGASTWVHINATQYYKYLRLRITKIHSGLTSYARVAELQYWGHEEGDTSVDVVHRSIPNTPGTQQLAVYYEARDPNSYSFADSSNVYDLSGSGVTGTITGNNGFDAEYNAWVFDGSGDYIESTLPSTFVDDQVHTVSLWFKRASNHDGTLFSIAPTSGETNSDSKVIQIRTNDSSGYTLSYIFWSNDLQYNPTIVDDTWYHLCGTYTGGGGTKDKKLLYLNGSLIEPTQENGTVTNVLDIDASSKIRLGSRINHASINYLDGSISNFRLFGKALNAEQIRELYEYDAPRFGHRQNLVALHKGNLGVGVAHPTSRFEVAGDETVQEYPPRAMTAAETYMEGHGVFRANWANWWSGNIPWGMYSKTVSSGNWYGPYEGNNGYSGGYVYSGTDFAASTTSGLFLDDVNGTRYYGAWTTITMPYDIILKRIHLYQAGSSDDVNTRSIPEDGVILGSHNGSDWYHVHTFTGLTYGGSVGTSSYSAAGESVAVNAIHSYKHYALVTTRTLHYAFTVIIGELYWYGTPAPSSLEDGHLTLGKALTLPRVSGHPAGAETPRAESLVVHYDTTVDSVVSGSAVVDVSGNGINGTLTNGAAYSSTDRALVFDGVNDYIQSTTTLGSGNITVTISMWINSHAYPRWFMWLGADAGATGEALGMIRYENEYQLNVRNGNTFKVSAGALNTWEHLVFIYHGTGSSKSAGTMEGYVNGVLGTVTLSNLNDDQLNIGANPELEIGARTTAASDGYLNGSISNFKLWNVALTAEEVAMEYALGRTGKSLNLTDTSLCLGGTVPRAQLDVRGGARFDGRVGIGNQPDNAVDGNAYPDTFPASSIHIHQKTTAENTESEGIRFSHPLNVGRWNLFMSSNNHFRFAYNGSSKGYVDQGDPNNQMNFTGQHRTFIKDTPFTRAEELEGLIVSADNNKYIKMSGGIEAGSNAITTNESLPVVSLSTKVNDKKCFGVISASEDPETREDAFGNFVSVSEKELGDTRVYINSVGEGAMWVTDINGPLESGDYITTSNVAGYGQKQESDSLKNYTVAKITMDCDFEPATQPIQRIKQSNVVETHYTGMVPVVKGVPHEFVTTVVGADDTWSNVSVSPSDVTYAEWSNLEANVQNTYTLTYTQTSNVVYDVKYTKTTTANVTAEDAWDAVHIEPSTVTYAEYSNLEANVQNTYSLTYTMTTKVEATEAIYSNLSTEDKELFIPTYYHMAEQRVNAEYPGAVKHETVTDRLENALDEHGQLQWEDHPTETEKAYKIRYLDASGAQTDEANAVHTAAFVGVTYHCG
jgi:hypothetical protein